MTGTRVRTIAAIVFVLLVGRATPTWAQFDGSRGSFPGCPTCGVFSAVDLPAPEQTVSQQNFVVWGWGFECVGGATVDRVDVWYQTYDGTWRPLKQADGTLQYGVMPRPDVQAYYRTACPRVPLNSGWVLSLTRVPPLGLRRVVFNVWRGPYFEQHRRTYLIVP